MGFSPVNIIQIYRSYLNASNCAQYDIKVNQLFLQQQMTHNSEYH